MRQLEFRKFRFLFIVLGLTLLAALWELSDPDPENNPQLRVFPSTWMELYPESTDTLYTIGRGHAERGDLGEARIYFERALATGDKTKEDLYFEYAVLLVRMHADQHEIDQAIATWKRYFPFSTLPDPMLARDPPGGRADQ